MSSAASPPPPPSTSDADAGRTKPSPLELVYGDVTGREFAANTVDWKGWTKAYKLVKANGTSFEGGFDETGTALRDDFVMYAPNWEYSLSSDKDLKLGWCGLHCSDSILSLANIMPEGDIITGKIYLVAITADAVRDPDGADCIAARRMRVLRVVNGMERMRLTTGWVREVTEEEKHRDVFYFRGIPFAGAAAVVPSPADAKEPVTVHCISPMIEVRMLAEVWDKQRVHLTETFCDWMNNHTGVIGHDDMAWAIHCGECVATCQNLPSGEMKVLWKDERFIVNVGAVIPSRASCQALLEKM